MAQTQEVTNHSGDNLEALQEPLKTEPLEKFPSFVQTRSLSAITRSKSLTQMHIDKVVTGREDLAATIKRLKDEEPPESLVEAWERRANVKKLRRDTISMIRSRTASRISNNGRL